MSTSMTSRDRYKSFVSLRNFTLARALFVHTLLFCTLTFPYWGKGEVVAPNRQLTEVGLHAIPADHETESPIYRDYTDAFIPAVTEHLRGLRSGWLALWTNENELGHPLYHLGGLSPAYAPSWVIAQFTDDPWRFMTVLSLLTCYVAGVFLMLYCNEVDLSPFAALVAGVSLSSSPLLMASLAFPMTLAAWCWAAGILWSITRLAKNADLLGWTVLAFSIYSLLMTAAPQRIVFNAYILVPYGMYLVFSQLRHGLRDAAKFSVLAGSAAAAAVALASPAYLDIAGTFAESSRISPPPSFYMSTFSSFGTLTNYFLHMVVNVIPSIFGNPFDPDYPITNIALHLTPLMVFFLIIALLTAFRQTWGWWLAIAMFLCISFDHSLYLFGIKYLGFNLDNYNPLGTVLVPAAVLVAYGTNALVRNPISRGATRAAWIATISILIVLICGVKIGLTDNMQVHWDEVSMIVVLLTLLMAQVVQPRPLLIVGALLLVLAAIASPLMPRVDLHSIATTSPLIEKLRTNIPPGSRYAYAGHGLYIVPPNVNAELGIASIHSYDSLSPKNYHLLIESLGGKVLKYGRWNTSISPDYNSSMFWMSNISLMLSTLPLVSNNLMYAGEESNIKLYRVISRMGEDVQVRMTDVTENQNGVQVEDPRLLQTRVPSKLSDEGDLVEYQAVADVPSVLILSQKFHRDWHAMILNQAGWIPANTTMVNGVFQGILLPQGTQRVKLEFKPFVRYAWIAHVFWLILLLILIFRGGHRLFKRSITSPGSRRTIHGLPLASDRGIESRPSDST